MPAVAEKLDKCPVPLSKTAAANLRSTEFVTRGGVPFNRMAAGQHDACMALVFAVVHQSVTVLGAFCESIQSRLSEALALPSGDRRRKFFIRDAKTARLYDKWLLNDSPLPADYPFAFVNICKLAGADVAAARKSIYGRIDRDGLKALREFCG